MMKFGKIKHKGGKINMDKKYVYLFSEGNSNMRELLGGKGANLAEMTNLRFTCSTRFYHNY